MLGRRHKSQKFAYSLQMPRKSRVHLEGRFGQKIAVLGGTFGTVFYVVVL